MGYIMADLVTVIACLATAVASEFLSRALGLLVALSIATLGLILFAVTRNMPTLSAGQVFYGVGFTGVRLMIDVLVSDTTRSKNRPLAYAFIATPWSLTAFTVPAIRRDRSSSEIRPAVAAFAGIIPLLGGLLCLFLRRHRERMVKPKPFHLLVKQLQKPKLNRTFPRKHSTRRSWFKPLRLGLPLSTFFVVMPLLSLFVLLWLVQMDIVPWFVAVPPAVMLLSVVALNIALQYTGFNFRVQSYLQRCLARQSSERLSVVRYYNHWLEDILGRVERKLEKGDPTWCPDESVLSSLNGGTMFAICGLCLTWKRGSSRRGQG